MAARAAAATLSPGMPGFFVDAAAQLEYLDPEPDRWRDSSLGAMDEAFAYDHYIDLENVPEGALDAVDRWQYLDRIYAAGIDDPVRSTGFLPFRILELYQRLLTEWRLWRTADSNEERSWIEARIINDAGLLGHYITDASQPHHTTIHFNGWAEGTPNPEGFTTDRGFHARFESAFVDAHVEYAAVLSVTGGQPHQTLVDVRATVMDYLLESNQQVETLYRLEATVGFDPGRPAHPRARIFATDRLAAGAAMLRDLWWSAWVESAR